MHRLNQTVDVKVYKMTVKDTVEARILDLQTRKRELASATIEGKAAATKLTMKDMMALFGHDAHNKFRDGDELDLPGKGRLLETPKDSDETFGRASSSSASGQGRRATPPVMESSRNQTKRPTEDSVYGRRW